MTIHFSGDTSNAELFFRTLHIANQFSIHGAVSNWCEELVQQIFVGANQGHSGGIMIDLAILTMTKFHLDGKSSPTTSEVAEQ